MHVLNLDPDFTPVTEGTVLHYKSFTFPGGEKHIRVSELNEGGLLKEYTLEEIRARLNKNH